MIVEFASSAINFDSLTPILLCFHIFVFWSNDDLKKRRSNVNKELVLHLSPINVHQCQSQKETWLSCLFTTSSFHLSSCSFCMPWSSPKKHHLKMIFYRAIWEALYQHNNGLICRILWSSMAFIVPMIAHLNHDHSCHWVATHLFVMMVVMEMTQWTISKWQSSYETRLCSLYCTVWQWGNAIHSGC